MLQSQLFTKTLREAPKDEVSTNAQLLERGGFVYKNSAGIYTFLPLGWRVLQKIADIIREEMNNIGAQELFMPALVEKKYLDATGRWDMGVGFKVYGEDKDAAATETENYKLRTANYVLGWTHEEVLTEITSKYIASYKDLPFAAYQIQTKFRNEPRAKSGLLRGREFIMKDLYSFHASQDSFEKYYEKAKDAYMKIFERCGLKAIYTLAAGGDFTASTTHEFQVLSPIGEDTIYVCQKCAYAENNEISKLADGAQCPKCGGNVKMEKSVEVGNVFPLGTKYTEAFNVQFTNEKGEKQHPIMGSYGIGLGRVMATIVEVHHDEKGILWPKSIAPFDAHLLVLDSKDTGKRVAVRESADRVYADLTKTGISVLYDDREGVSPGEKFADSDLIGIPIRLVVSEKMVTVNSVEVKKRNVKETELVKSEEVLKTLIRNAPKTKF